MTIRSILLAFIFIFISSIVGMTIFIETEKFGSIISKIISEISLKKLNAKIKFKDLSISYFPLGIELNHIEIERLSTEEDSFFLEIKRLGYYLKFADPSRQKFSFGELQLTDGFFKYLDNTVDDEELNEINPELIKKIFKYKEDNSLPVDSVEIINLIGIVNQISLEIKVLSIFKKKNSFWISANIENLLSKKLSNQILDELWIEVDVYKEKIKLNELSAMQGVNKLSINGEIINYYKLMGADLRIQGACQAHLKNLNEFLILPDLIIFQEGTLNADISFFKEDKKLNGNLKLFIENLESSFLDSNKVLATLSFNQKIISVKDLKIDHENQELNLLKPFVLYDVEKSLLLPDSIEASLKEFSLGNAIKVLGPEFNLLSGYLSGNIKFSKKNNFYQFYPLDNFSVSNLRLGTSEKKDSVEILNIKKLFLRNSFIGIDNGAFLVNTDIKFPGSDLHVEGSIKNKLLNFKIPVSHVDLEDFGNISNLDLKGKGKIEFDITGKIPQAIFSIKSQMNDFEILNYKLGKTNKDILINLLESTVYLNKVDSQIGKTLLHGEGMVNFKSEEIALGITSNEVNHDDLSLILYPLFSRLDFLPDDLDYSLRADVDIFGKYNLTDLKLRSKVQFKNLFLYKETIDQGSFDLNLENRILSFLNFDASKNKGEVFGSFKFDLGRDLFQTNLIWENIETQSLNLYGRNRPGLNAFATGSLVGGGPITDYNLNLETIVFDTKVGSTHLEDSKFTFSLTPDRLKGKFAIFGETILGNISIPFVKNRSTSIDLLISSTDIKPLLIATLGPHIEKEIISGEIGVKIDLNVEENFKNFDFSAHIRDLKINHQEFNLNYSSFKPQFVIQKNFIRSWNLLVDEKDLRITTSAFGEVGKKSQFKHEINFNTKLLQILFDPVMSAEGFSKNVLTLENVNQNFFPELRSNGTEINLTLDDLSIPLNNLSYNILLVDKKISINNLSLNFETGRVFVIGDIFLDNDDPDINLKLNIDKADIPILSKSFLNISGEGVILGNQKPYSLSGELIINSAQILNELNEFSSKSSAFSEIKFLPQDRESSRENFFMVNLNVKAENPIRITNSLMDVAFLGEVRLTGNPYRPKGDGRLTMPMNSSRVFFKNNEYLITRGDISFQSKKEITNPDFDIRASTLISNHKIYPKAYGDLERFNFDLTSDPPLPRNSILSLIAFGYTNEIQTSLYARDQQNLTQVGVGSFVFDRFKISDILNKQFGLQVNLGTVIEQSSTDSLIRGRGQDSGTGTVGRTRSATKIELKKRLDEELTLSVSSTMGGSIGQRQSMNLNYDLTKNVQVEGVYELRTNEEGQADIIYNSIGGDLKFRRTFK